MWYYQTHPGVATHNKGGMFSPMPTNAQLKSAHGTLNLFSRADILVNLIMVWAIRLTWNYFRREEWKFGQREDWR